MGSAWSCSVQEALLEACRKTLGYGHYWSVLYYWSY